MGNEIQWSSKVTSSALQYLIQHTFRLNKYSFFVNYV